MCNIDSTLQTKSWFNSDNSLSLTSLCFASGEHALDVVEEDEAGALPASLHDENKLPSVMQLA